MPYLYGISDTKFLVKKKKVKKKKEILDTPAVKFKRHELLAGPVKFDHNKWPIQFRATPDSLVALCVCAVDKLPMPSIYEWSDKDIRLWICRYGYPQYMNTFRVNMIWGRKLLLLDADALQAMNIKDFDHIKHITYGIRMLFHFELTKFSHSISQPDEKSNELYLLWHTQTGINYDALCRSDLYIRMKMLKERSLNFDHWDMLYLWLRRERERKYTELVGLVPRHSIYECQKDKHITASQHRDEPVENICGICIPPCDCDWTERDMQLPWRLRCLSPGLTVSRSKWLANEKRCTTCIPPCECRWPSRYYLTGTVMKCLQQKFPEKFAPIFDERITTVLRPSLVERWTRFSI